MAKIQLRGHCQCCGRQQAVMRGYMAKHGYEVKNGWFNGVCTGANYQPIEASRERADEVCSQVRAESARLMVRAAELRDGTGIVHQIDTTRRDPKTRQPITIAWEDATPGQRRSAQESVAWHCESRARAGRQFADDLEKLANECHGKPLMEIRAPEAPEPIYCGHQRKHPRGVLTVTSVYSGMVRWKDDRGFIGSMSTRAWRALPTA